jgi:hypothetical protein
MRQFVVPSEVVEMHCSISYRENIVATVDQENVSVSRSEELTVRSPSEVRRDKVDENSTL